MGSVAIKRGRKRVNRDARLNRLLNNNLILDAGVIQGVSKNYPAKRPDNTIRSQSNRSIVKIANILRAGGWDWFTILQENRIKYLSIAARNARLYLSGDIRTIDQVYRIIGREMVEDLKITLKSIQAPQISDKWKNYKSRHGSNANRTDILRWSDHLLKNQVYRVRRGSRRSSSQVNVSERIDFDI